jgi:signal transduction histidine kinase
MSSPTSELLATDILRVLILEDTDADAELVEHQLRRDGLQFEAIRVSSREEFQTEILERPPDLILSDYSLPRFSGLEALRFVNSHECTAPFILVTGSQTEEVAVECMKEGAADYILKSTLTRLPSAVRNALDRRQSEKEKEEALYALRQSQEQLLQSQKLEAVGRLAGGIAHDFNNLLTAIMGHSELALRQPTNSDRLQRNLTEIKKASERAASLTRQLLAFSRKQVLQPRVFALNSVVVDLERMLQRMIGEDIAFRTSLQPSLGNVKADPGQIEQVIMNLVVNARDAMPDGGHLTIETANVYLDETYAHQHIAIAPGNYVMLAVSDTGVGMDAETSQRAFEPFFTTKETGKGTGLGLSMVYGIVKQSGGNIWVYSEVGNGTTFKIYLPRVDETAQPFRDSNAGDPVRRGFETILLVEDSDTVRKLAKEVLEDHGYHVLEAEDGRAALKISRNYPKLIHLLLTDVVMPEMSGRSLAEELLPLNPRMRLLYMSGYAQDAIVHHGVLEEGTSFLQKPFSPDALALKVREVLEK